MLSKSLFSFTYYVLWHRVDICVLIRIPLARNPQRIWISAYNSFFLFSRNFNNLYFCPRETTYPMNNQKRGYCIIFNVENIGGSIRNGTDIDVKRLRKCFNVLGFHVIVKQNPTRAQIHSTMTHCKLFYDRCSIQNTTNLRYTNRKINVNRQHYLDKTYTYSK